MIFFVLSGYVISFVATTKEKTISDFIFARASRLYSVIIPAIFITLLCNELGNLYIQDNYKGPWNTNEPYEYFRYVISALMLQDIWGAGLSPTNNGPFWSISFEAFYYIFFALIFYIKNKWRFVFLIVFALIAGPTIVLLFPLWLLGYYAYRYHAKGTDNLDIGTAYVLFALGIVILAASPIYRNYFSFTYPMVSRESFIGDYIDASAFYLHLLAVPVVAKKLGPLLYLFRRPIAFLSSLTFSLYLFHQPLIRFFAGISPFIDEPASMINRGFVYSLTFLVILIVGIPAEGAKVGLNKLLRSFFPKYQGNN